MPIRGFVDSVTTKYAEGWIFSNETRDIVVQALLDNQIIGEAEASIIRPDLAAAGFGDGKAGYSIQFYREIDPIYLPFVIVKPEGGDLEIPRFALSGYGDFFQALYKKKPALGRSRSIFGGLWTDRTDAAAMLKGKVRAGQFNQAQAETLEAIIRTGITMLPSLGEPAYSRLDQIDLTEATASLLFQKPLLWALSAVLDDQPIAVEAGIERDGAGPFRQPSSLKELPSPTECLLVVAPATEQSIELFVIRDSHLFPDFTYNGTSRWITRDFDSNAAAGFGDRGLVDRYEIGAGAAAIIGPGSIYSIRSQPGSAIRALCIPERQVTAELLVRAEKTHASGAKVLL